MPEAHKKTVFLPRWSPFHNENYVKAAQLMAAVAVGMGAYLFAIAAAEAQNWFNRAFESGKILTCLGAPLIFLASAWVVRHFAPEAKGSGIPQVLLAIDQASANEAQALSGPLISLRTASIKVISAAMALLAGASIGREGPTIQIASSLFAFVARKARRFATIHDPRSFLVAGAAAGVSAAFNTPLAGITFALEEIVDGSFSQFKSVVLLCVIVSGITAQALGGNYLYFGHPQVGEPSSLLIAFAALLGLIGGLAGGLFSKSLTQGLNGLLPKSWWMRALVCGAFCTLIAWFSGGLSSGSGYESTKKFMESGPAGTLPALFFPEKFLTTIFSYLSGVAGGIFSPCLAIGAGLGAYAGQVLHAPDLKACALIGMVAFFSGVVQAPLTAVIIIMEMTDQHLLIIPFLVAAFVAHGIGKRIMPVPLYHHLAFHRSEAKPEN